MLSKWQLINLIEKYARLSVCNLPGEAGIPSLELRISHAEAPRSVYRQAPTSCRFCPVSLYILKMYPGGLSSPCQIPSYAIVGDFL